jgi:hypothetical protein
MVKTELKQKAEEVNKLKFAHVIEMDQQKEKYQELLHANTELDARFNELQLTFGAKEQECLTLESHNAI